jgi:hypothetical protein
MAKRPKRMAPGCPRCGAALRTLSGLPWCVSCRQTVKPALEDWSERDRCMTPLGFGASMKIRTSTEG